MADKKKLLTIIVTVGVLILIFLFIELFFLFYFFRKEKFTESLSTKKIAVVRITGPLYDAKEYVDEIEKYSKDSFVKGIVLRFESPGGSVVAAQEMYQVIKKVRKNGKKVVASMGGVAASGAYYIACACDKIFANPGTLTGSIGVILEFPNFEGLFQKIGLRFEVVKSGRFKDTGSSSRPLTDEEKRILQDLIDDVYNQFVDAIEKGREKNISKRLQLERNLKAEEMTDILILEEIKRLADGRVFSGQQALKLSLIDSLGTLNDAINFTASEAGIKGEPSVVEREERSFFERLLGITPLHMSVTEYIEKVKAPTLMYIFR